MSLLSLLVANLAALLGAHALLRRLRTGVASTDAVLFLLLHLLVISVAMLVAGWTGLLNSGRLGLAGGVVLTLLLLLGEHRRLPRLRLPVMGRFLLIFGGLLLLRSLLQVWYLAPFQRDALTYHLPKIGEWIQHEGFTSEWGLDLRSTFPAGFELVETWWVVFLRHDVLIEMAGLEFLALGAVSIADLARRLGVADRFACLAGFLYALTPGLALQATSCLNDGPVASVWTATAALVLRRLPPPLAVLPVALGMGIKGTYVYALPGLALLWAVAGRPAILPTTRGMVAVAATALLAGSSWYVRNAVVYGNPIHPMGRAGIIAHESHVAQQFGPTLTSLKDNLRRAATSRIYDHLAPFDPELTHISGWGALPFAGGILGLFLLLRGDPGMRKVAAAYAVSLLSVFVLVVSDPWFMRYALFLPGLFALAAAKAAETRPSLSILAHAALLFGFLATIVPGAFPVDGVSTLASMPWRERTLYPHPGLAKVEAVGFLEAPDSEEKIYPVYRPDFSRRVFHLRPTSVDGLGEAMRREGLAFLFCPGGHSLASEGLRRGLLATTLTAGLYALRPPP